MVKLSCILFLYLGIFSHGTTQNKSIDADSLLAQAQSLRFSDSEGALSIALSVLDVVKGKKHEIILDKAYSEVAFNYRILRKHREAIAYSKAGLQNSKDVLRIGKFNESIGLSYSELGELDSAIFYFDHTYKHFLANKLMPETVIPLIELGKSAIFQNQMKLAEDFLLKAHQEASRHEKRDLKMISLLNLIQFYKSADQLDQYSAFLEEGLDEFGNVDWKDGSLPMHVRMFLILDEKSFEEDENLLKLIETHAANKRWKSLSHTLIAIGEYWYKKGDYQKAIDYLDKSLDYSHIKIEPSNLNIHYWKYKSYKALGNIDSSIESFETYHALKDSINNVESRNNIEELNIKYNTLQKEKDLIKRQNENRILWTALLLTVPLIISIIVGYRTQSKKQQLITSQQFSLKNKEIQHLEQQNKILGLSSLIEGQETERTRIAKDLHDGLGGILSSVKAHYGKIQEEFKTVKNMQVYGKAQAMMDEAVDEVRRISHNMMPPMLRVNGLAAAVTGFLENVAGSHNLKLALDVRNMEERIEENKALFVYRIIQELTNNVVKHAEATEIQLQMIRLGDQIQIIFEDNGKGFNYRLDKSMGVGLRSIRSRMDYLGGEIDFTSSPGKGTVVEMVVPC